VFVFRRCDDETAAAFDRLPKPVDLLRPVCTVLILIVERQVRIQNVEADLVGQMVAQATNVAREKDAFRRLPGRPTSLTRVRILACGISPLRVRDFRLVI
jgi:hypothetical protein